MIILVNLLVFVAVPRGFQEDEAYEDKQKHIEKLSNAGMNSTSVN